MLDICQWFWSFQFLQTFFTDVESEKDSSLVICNSCHLKLDNFKLFWLQFKTNANLLSVFRQRQQQSIKTENIIDNKPTVLDDVIRERLCSLKPLDFSIQRQEMSDGQDDVPDTSTPHDDLDDSPASPPSLTIPQSLSRISGGHLGSDERRRQRNREASRRYRERARSNPDLLRRMREQQNARQKKYYARLRQRKQSSTSSLVRF